MRQLAWLNATPKPPEGAEAGKTIDPKTLISRREALEKEGVKNPAMPPCPSPHIVECLVEAGLSESNGMAAVPLTWREIRAWQESTCIPLEPWEARLLKTLSIGYAAETARAGCTTCPAPWHREVTQQERDVDEEALSALFG